MDTVQANLNSNRRVVIIGGGIAGLSAAWHLQQAGIAYTLLEQSPLFGGLVQTERVDELVIEHGPDAFITRKPAALELVHALGISDQLQTVNLTQERIYVLVKKRLVPLPEGLRLLVPTQMTPFLQSPILSWWGKLRLLMDLRIPPRKRDDDESLADFVRRRMGKEALDRLADPLLAGVFNADMERQSILATFPQYRQLERKYGSLIRGMRDMQSTTENDSPALLSLKGGMRTLIDALVEQLTGELIVEARVEKIEPANGRYQVTLDDGDIIEGDHVILATPAYVSSRLLWTITPPTAHLLRTIHYEGVGSMTLAFARDAVPQKLDAYGVVIPASGKRPIDGMQFSSAKWSGRAPENTVLIRVFFGGPHTRPTLNLADGALLKTVRTELKDILGITAEPLFTSTRRWRHAYPQYDVGHIERVNAIFDTLPADIHLAGNAYRGVGVPDTIRSGKAAAARVVEALAIEKTET